MAITKLIRTALDRAVHKELIDTKAYFFEGLAVVLWSSIKVCTNICIVQGSCARFVTSVPKIQVSRLRVAVIDIRNN